MVLLQNMAFFSLISLASSPIRPLAMHHWCGGWVAEMTSITRTADDRLEDVDVGLNNVGN